MTSPLRNSVPVRIAVTALLLLALAAVYVFTGESSSEPETPLVCETDSVSAELSDFGRALQDLAVVSTDGTPAMLHDLGGRRLTVLLFCSYRCPCSDGYTARLRELQERYGPAGVSFIALDANANEHLEGLADYKARMEYPLPMYLDDLHAVADALEAAVTPEAFIFDSTWSMKYHGRIDDDKSGLQVTDHSLANALDTLLAGHSLAVREKTALGCAIVREVREP